MNYEGPVLFHSCNQKSTLDDPAPGGVDPVSTPFPQL
jgi:hypothetical protein